MMNATPGPWVAVDRSEMGAGGGTWRIVAGKRTDATLVASISEWSAEVAAANARLIAQAPAMYNALRALTAGVEDAVLRFLDSHELALRADMDIVLRARVDRARAILAAIEVSR